MADVRIKGVGANDGVEVQIDGMYRAMRMSARPNDVSGGGSYSIALASGVMAAGVAGGSPIVAVRWASPNFLFLLKQLRLTASTDTTAFAQGSVIFDVIKATGFTVQDTNGALVAFTANKTQTKASRFAASQLANAAGGSIQVGVTGALIAGTRTLDTNAMGNIIGSVGALPLAALAPPPGLLFDATFAGGQPLELVQNEGFIIRATVPITGTWKFGVSIDWDEVDPKVWLG